MKVIKNFNRIRRSDEGEEALELKNNQVYMLNTSRDKINYLDH